MTAAIRFGGRLPSRSGFAASSRRIKGRSTNHRTSTKTNSPAICSASWAPEKRAIA